MHRAKLSTMHARAASNYRGGGGLRPHAAEKNCQAQRKAWSTIRRDGCHFPFRRASSISTNPAPGDLPCAAKATEPLFPDDTAVGKKRLRCSSASTGALPPLRGCLWWSSESPGPEIGGRGSPRACRNITPSMRSRQGRRTFGKRKSPESRIEGVMFRGPRGLILPRNPPKRRGRRHASCEERAGIAPAPSKPTATGAAAFGHTPRNRHWCSLALTLL